MTSYTEPEPAAAETQLQSLASGDTALIVNTKARRGREWYDRTLECLSASGIDVVAKHALDDPSRLPEVIRGCLQQNLKRIVVGGGDGTLRSAAGILVGTDATLGILPLGTVNDLARNLCIKPDVESACRIIVEGYTERIHVGRANDDYFVITASLGFSAQSQTALKPELKKLFGPFGYIIASLITLRRLRELCIHIRRPEQEASHDVLQAGVISGHSWMGGAFEIPGVNLESGRLAFYALPPQPVRNYLRIAKRIKEGRFFHTPGLIAFMTDDITIETPTPQPLVLDGDLCGHTPVRLRLQREALQVFVPKHD